MPVAPGLVARRRRNTITIDHPTICGYCKTVEHRATAFTTNGQDLERFDRWHSHKRHDSGVYKVTPGDIFVSSWRYNQTNVDAYQVREITPSGKTVKVQKIATKIVGSRVRPVWDAWLNDGVYAGDENGKIIRDEHGLLLREGSIVALSSKYWADVPLMMGAKGSEVPIRLIVNGLLKPVGFGFQQWDRFSSVGLLMVVRT